MDTEPMAGDDTAAVSNAEVGAPGAPEPGADQDEAAAPDAQPDGAQLAAAGGLLSGQRLRQRLDQEDIFREGSWQPEEITGAVYTLRLGRNWMVIPDGSGGHRTIGADGGVGEVNLQPGESAVLATEEKWSLAFDLSAILGPKFRLAAQGLLVLHGLVTHPGYGWLRKGDAWEREADLRLYVIVTNIGPQAMHMRAGDPLLSVQFHVVEAPDERQEVDKQGFEKLKEKFFRLVGEPTAPGVGPGIFSGQLAAGAQAKEDVAALEQTLEEELRVRDGAIRALEASTANVVVFGVYLLTVTIFGVALVALIGAASNLRGASTANQILGYTLMLAYAFLAYRVGRSAWNRSKVDPGASSKPAAGRPAPGQSIPVGRPAGRPAGARLPPGAVAGGRGLGSSQAGRDGGE